MTGNDDKRPDPDRQNIDGADSSTRTLECRELASDLECTRDLLHAALAEVSRLTAEKIFNRPTPTPRGARRTRAAHEPERLASVVDLVIRELAACEAGLMDEARELAADTHIWRQMALTLLPDYARQTELVRRQRATIAEQSTLIRECRQRCHCAAWSRMNT